MWLNPSIKHPSEWLTLLCSRSKSPPTIDLWMTNEMRLTCMEDRICMTKLQMSYISEGILDKWNIIWKKGG